MGWGITRILANFLVEKLAFWCGLYLQFRIGRVCFYLTLENPRFLNKNRAKKTLGFSDFTLIFQFANLVFFILPKGK